MAARQMETGDIPQLQRNDRRSIQPAARQAPRPEQGLESENLDEAASRPSIGSPESRCPPPAPSSISGLPLSQPARSLANALLAEGAARRRPFAPSRQTRSTLRIPRLWPG